MLSAAELPPWLRLLSTPGLGRSAIRRLLAGLGSPAAVFDAPAEALRQFVHADQATALAAPPPGLDALLAATARWLSVGPPQPPRALVSIADTEYPPSLLETADPPLLLHLEGRVELLDTPSIAVVGSRRPTPQGIENAREIAAGLARAGQTVVSGLALGIDAAAHLGALDAGAGSIAVVGTGLDIVYPPRHRSLARRLAEEGLLVSEFALGTPPLAAHFPQRNRIIAGLCRGTLVIEAALRSGSLITARLAVEAGRDVFAVPGSIRSPFSSGCHALIKQGAKLVESAQDVLDELAFPAPAQRVAGAAPAQGDSAGGPVIEALGHDPASLDALLARTGMSVDALGAALLELELAGQVARLPGQLFQRIGRA